jgi:large subunit ribosomal protein L25
MAEQVTVTAKQREGRFNKNAAKRVRAGGKIPGVIYGAQESSVAVELNPKEIARILQSESGHNTIFDVDLGAGSASGVKTKVMIVDWQYEPIRGTLIHVDLKRIAMDKVIRVQVPVQFTGIPVGVKTQGGILDQVLREVEVECLPADIPSSISVDVTELSMGESLRVSDLPHGGSVKFLTDKNATVVHIVSIKEEVAAAPDAVAAAATEPEVAKKGKQETAEVAADAKPAKK